MKALVILKELAFRLKLFIFGVRFHEQISSTVPPKIFEVEYRIAEGKKIFLEFYKVECIDIVLKRNVSLSETFPSYVVRAHLVGDFPATITKYSGKSFFFNGRHNEFGQSDKMTAELIFDVFIDFLKAQMEKKEA